MFLRTVSTILIAALIACPMWCGTGLCYAGDCCLNDEEARQPACPVDDAECCCCDQSSQESGHHDCPADHSGKKSCQGICGGAIFGKPVELHDLTAAFFLPPVAAVMASASQVEKTRTSDVDRYLPGDGNYGRSLRTLHMSFLC